MSTRTTTTVLDTVLKAHGAQCGCTGACGKEHAHGRCGRLDEYGKPPLHAAPYPPYTTDAENAAAPLDELRPWCGPCWNRATTRERDRRADRRRRELDEAQIALFDVEPTAA
ncbi:hypothetical protein ACFV6U_37265 [Streptomyces sp. NPDC059810]|uniref:hypothetical protein n=1 Tax=Streptomyces sp. NPDC059810 TaxID=3346956 RepID=UPI003663F190